MLKSLLMVSAVAVLALSTPACSSLGAVAAEITSGVQPVANAGLRSSLVDDKGWAATLSVYVALTNAYTAGVKNGLIKKDQVAVIRPLRTQAASIRLAGQDAYEAGNATNLGAQVAALRDIIGKLQPLIPGAPPLPR